MTLTTTNARNDYVGAASVGPYPYTFKIFAGPQLAVYVTNTTTGLTSTLTYLTDYTVAGAGAESGGTITLTVALAVGSVMSIQRNVPLTQLSDFRNQGEFFPADYEAALDYEMMVSQYIEDQGDSAVQLAPTTDPAVFSPILPANLVAGNAIVVNATATGFSMGALSSATLSAWNAANAQRLDVYTSAHGDFTAGVTTTLTTSSVPGGKANLTITFDVAGLVTVLQSDDYSVVGSVVTFGAPITAGTTRVEIKYFLTYQINTADSANVTYVNAAAVVSDVQTELRSVDASIVTLNSEVATLTGQVVGTVTRVFNVMDYGALGNGSHDDTTAIQTASTACNAAGGGILYFPVGTYKITGAVTVTRLVNVLGAGPGVTTITAASIQPFKVVGSALSWAGNTIQDIGFQTVDVYLGTLITDQMQGASVVNCLFRNCVYSIYFGYNCFFTRVVRCEFVDCTYGSFVDAGTATTTSGAMMRWRDCEIHDSGSTGLSHVGICLSGVTIQGYDLYVDTCEFEHLTVAAIQVIGGSNRAYLSLRDIHFERMGASAYHLINDGAVIQLDGFWSFSASEAGMINSSGGRTSIARGFYNWIPGAFALVTGGTIQIDAETIYSPSRWWGSGQQVMEIAGSTTGGMIVAKRAGVVGMSFVSTALLTNTTPAAAAIVICQAGDGNERVLELVVSTTVVTTDNIVRFQLADGSTTVNCDVSMPLFVGVAHLRLTWKPGTSVTVDGVFSGTAPGATTTKGLYVTHADTTSFGLVRFLNISTIKSGTTCATLQIVDMTETISGPFQVDT
jgi:hypothetical protein